MTARGVPPAPPHLQNFPKCLSNFLSKTCPFFVPNFDQYVCPCITSRPPSPLFALASLWVNTRQLGYRCNNLLTLDIYFFMNLMHIVVAIIILNLQVPGSGSRFRVWGGPGGQAGGQGRCGGPPPGPAPPPLWTNKLKTFGFFTISISDRKADRRSARQKNSGK